jgi:hypothetical protein
MSKFFKKRATFNLTKYISIVYTYSSLRDYWSSFGFSQRRVARDQLRDIAHEVTMDYIT